MTTTVTKVFDLGVDLETSLVNAPFSISQNDLNSVQLNFTITNNSVVVDLTPYTVRIAVQKPSGLIVYQDCPVTDAINGKAEVILSTQAYIEAGKHICEVYVKEGITEVGVTGQFFYNSRSALLSDTTLQSSNDFQLMFQASQGGGTGGSIIVDDNLLSTSTTDALSANQGRILNTSKANTVHTHLSSDVTGLATVATSGSYTDLINKPTIPATTSQLTNDSNYVVDVSYVHTDSNYTATEKTKLAGLANYTLPSATGTVLGGIKVGTGLAIDGSGVLSATGGGTGGGGGGDMLKSIYDVDANGVVDNSEKLNGQLPSYYLDYANLTGKPTIPTTTSQLTNNSGFLTAVPIATTLVLGGIKVGTGLAVDVNGVLSGGDMLKSVYDTTANGIVDNAEKLNGQLPSYYLTYGNLTGTPTIPTTTSQLTNNSGFLTSVPTASATVLGLIKVGTGLAIDGTGILSTSGVGDMLKSTYDTTANGVVDNSEKLNGQLPSYYLTYGNLTGTPTIPTTTSQLTNNSNFAVDASYVHTDSNYTATEKTKLAGLSNYTLPISSATVLGGFKVGSGLSIDGTGILSANVVGDMLKATYDSTANGIVDNAEKLNGQLPSYYLTYGNLTGTPTIPTTTSQLTNNSGFLTSVPTASASVLGGVKVGSGLAIDGSGILSATGGGGGTWGSITGTLSSQTDLNTALNAKVGFDSTGGTGTATSMWTGTLAQYNAIGTKVTTTLYIITG